MTLLTFFYVKKFILFYANENYWKKDVFSVMTGVIKMTNTQC